MRRPSPLELTTWRCDVCRMAGVIQHEPCADVWEVVQRILASHGRVAPQCRGDRDTIRITSRSREVR